MHIIPWILQKPVGKKKKIRLFLQKNLKKRYHAKYFVYKKLLFRGVVAFFGTFSEIKTNF